MSTEYQHIVRIVGNDIPGGKNVIVGLTQIKGVGYMFANTILDVLKINPNQRIGHLTPEHVKSIENILKNPLSSNFPSWFLNRRKDIETGEDKHLITSDIAFTVRNDIEREKTIGSWRGYRHTFGLKVRQLLQKERILELKLKKVQKRRKHLQLERRKHLQLERRKHLQLIKRNR